MSSRPELIEDSKTLATRDQEEISMNSAIRWRIMVLQGVMTLVLAAGAIFAFSIGTFTTGQITSELTAQQISFPTTAQLAADTRKAEYPAELNNYVTDAGVQIDNGDKARVYANDYLGIHLKDTAGGLTYATVGTKVSQLQKQQAALSKSDPQYAALQQQITTLNGQRDTLFKGETLRSMLLNAYGWWTIGVYTTYASYALAIAALIVLGALVFEFLVAFRKVEQAQVVRKPAATTA
jgi:hypothetical protein